MFLTNVLLKKAKSKMIMVLMESVVSGHQCIRIRERLGDKLEFIYFDPYKKRNTIDRISRNKHKILGIIDYIEYIIHLRDLVSTRKLIQGEKEDQKPEVNIDLKKYIK